MLGEQLYLFLFENILSHYGLLELLHALIILVRLAFRRFHHDAGDLILKQVNRFKDVSLGAEE